MLGEVSSNCSVKPCVLSQQVGPCKLLVRNAQVRCAVPIFGSRCCYSRVIVSFSGTPTSFRLRSTVLVFGAAVLLVLGARVVLPCCEASPVHPHRSVSASADRVLALASHDHVQDESICSSDISAAAVLPRMRRGPVLISSPWRASPLPGGWRPCCRQ